MEQSLTAENHYLSYKPLLFSLAYRLLGSVMDAEDIVQEAFLAWTEKPPENIRNEKAYLCKIVSNRCMDRIRSASKQREVYVGPWLPEPLLTEETADLSSPASVYMHKESLSTAYLLLLQQLTWVERAVFVLREVLQFEYDEIGEIVGKSSTNCRQIFHRAKGAIATSSGESTEETAKPEKLKHIIDQFVLALSTGNVGQVVSMLKSEASLYSDGGGKVTAAIRPILGAERIAQFLFGLLSKVPPDYAFRILSINGQPGIVSYIGGKPNNVMTFHIKEGVITNIYNLLNPDKLLHMRPLDS